MKRIVPGLRARLASSALLALWVSLLAVHPVVHSHAPRFGLNVADRCSPAGELCGSEPAPAAIALEGDSAPPCSICLIHHLPRQAVVPQQADVALVATPLADAATPRRRHRQPPLCNARAPPLPTPRSVS